MEILVEQELMEVLSRYDYEITDIRCINDKGKKGVWWVGNIYNDMVLKKVSCSQATLKFLQAATKYLIERECKLPMIIPTTDNSNFTEVDGKLYVLYEAIAGRKLDDSIVSEKKEIVTEMAKFHKASIGFVPPSDSKPKNHLGLWKNEYNTYLEGLNVQFQEKLASNQRSETDKLITNEFPYFYRRAKKAIEGLSGVEYRNWVVKVNRLGGICHQDFSSANLLKTDKGIYVLDTDSLTIDLPARDIRKLLNKTMKKTHKWSIEEVSNFITWYNSQNRLTSEEWKVVMYDLMFPHLFLGSIHKYLNKRDDSWNEEDYYNRINEMAEFERTINPILRNYKILNKFI